MVKKCFLKKCDSTDIDGKIMIMVPKKPPERRRQWLEIAGRFEAGASTLFYCCEDHFELKEDAENWEYFKRAGTYLKLKPHVVPHLSLQTHRKRPKNQFTDSAKKRKEEFLSSLCSSSKVCTHMRAKQSLFSVSEGDAIPTSCIPPNFGKVDNDCSIMTPVRDIVSSGRRNQDFVSEVREATVNQPPPTDQVTNLEFCDKSRRKQKLTAKTINEEDMLFYPAVRADRVPERELIPEPQPENVERLGHYTTEPEVSTNPQPGPSIVRSPSPLALPIPLSPPLRPSRRNLLPHPRNVRCSSVSSVESSSSTVMSVQSSLCSTGIASTDLDRDFFKSRIFLLQQQLLKEESRFYFGLPKQHYLLVSKCCEVGQMYHRDVMIVFKKIRTNDAHKRLGHDFGIGTSQVSTTFNSCLPKLSSLLKHLVYWPSKRSVVLNMPLQFRYRFYKVQTIIDGFEIQIEKPSSAKHQALTWSDYKKCNTIKYLISCTPMGFINFISEGYGGRISDSLLVQKSGFLDVLPDGCDVLADRGFKQVERLLSDKNCTLIRPPSVGAGQQLSPELVKWSKRVSAVRIHIERVISRVREFAFLGPHANVDNHLVPLLDHAVTLACAIINLQDPIL